MEINPYKKIGREEIQGMKLRKGIVAVRGVLAGENSQIITDNADFRNCLYHEVIHVGEGCDIEPGQYCFVLGNTLSSASPDFEFCFVESEDIWAQWG